MTRWLVPLTFITKVLAYAAIAFGVFQIYLPAGWITVGVLGWWLLKEEIEPWVTLALTSTEDEST